MPDKSEIIRQFVSALLRLDAKEVRTLLANLPPSENGLMLLEEVVVPALEQIGESWEQGRISLSQVYMAGRICEQAVAEVLGRDESPPDHHPRLAIGVLQDYHSLGKRMVKSALHSAGYHLLDYGHGLKSSALVEMILRDRIDIMLISCLMLASAVQVGQVAAGLRRAGSSTLVVVGGAPFRLEPRLWEEVGAKAMGRNSAEAVGIVQKLGGYLSWK